MYVEDNKCDGNCFCNCEREKSASELSKEYGEVVDVPVKILDLKAWRDEWLEENDLMDGSDCVTPFDKYLY